uniref:NADH-ubiquinone oxidoreductase chain 2 n=1 Tax=Phlebopus portentosus TaxID=80661 RepID=A0A481ZNK7_9AGAM|nr:NADH dehydrogenase subunit 2 [Phlebopus portentosus]
MILISLLISIVAIAIPSIRINLSPNLFLRITSIIFIYAGGISLNSLYIQSIESGIGIYSGLFQVTIYTEIIDILIFITAALILTSWPIFNQTLLPKLTTGSKSSKMNNPCIEYSIIVLFSSLGSSLLISCADLISMYLSLELQSFGVYILATLYKDSESATSAGLKYFLLGSFSSCFILLGTALIYSNYGLTKFESIYSLNSLFHNYLYYVDPRSYGITLGLFIIFIGLLFKIAAAPLHNWAPDVYDNSPTIVTIWLTIMPKLSILYLLFEIYSSLTLSTSILVFEPFTFIFKFVYLFYDDKLLEIRNLFILTSFFSLILGTIVGLSQIKIKRLLAYSTISHIGFILLALGINSMQSLEALYFYIFQYTLTSLNIFLILLAFGYIINRNKILKNNLIDSDINFITELKGQFFYNPILTICLTICLFSMAGVPPLLGFFSKYFVLYSAIYNGYYFMAIIAILASVISASYYLKIIRVLHTEDTNNNNNNNNNIITEPSILSNTHSFLISTLTLSILLFLMKPSIILNSVQLLSLILYYT